VGVPRKIGKKCENGGGFRCPSSEKHFQCINCPVCEKVISRRALELQKLVRFPVEKARDGLIFNKNAELEKKYLTCATFFEPVPEPTVA
jgi:hypothetical protein